MIEQFHEEIPQQEPPLEWYKGIGKTDTGIVAIVYSQVLSSISNGTVGDLLAEYDHYSINPVAEDAPVEHKQIAEKALREAKEVVTLLTGFDPLYIFQMRIKLNRQYRGKFEAPFEVEWF